MELLPCLGHIPKNIFATTILQYCANHSGLSNFEKSVANNTIITELQKSLLKNWSDNFELEKCK